MAEATGLRNNALPYPVYGAPYGVSFPILDADGDLVTGATGLDSEISKNGDTFADCTNEATEIATASGMYYLLLTGTEMTADVVSIIVKTSSSSAKTTVLTLYPRKLVALRTGTAQGGAAGYITLDASAGSRDDRWNGCLCVAVIDTLTEARIITDYTGSNQQAAVTPNWNVTPDSDDTFTIYLPEGMQNPTVNVSHLSETAQTARDIGASVLLSSGTGTGQVTLSSGTVTLTDASLTAAKIATDAFTAAKFAADCITAAKIADGAIDAATFAAGAINAAALAADCLTAAKVAADVGTEIGTAVWATTTRLLTAGTNIVLAKGVGVTGFTDLDAAGIRTAVGLASANLDTQLTAIGDYLDTEVAAILAAVDTEVGAIKTVTDAIGATGSGLSAIPWNAAWDAEVQSECADALAAYDPPTNAEMEARTLLAASYATASELATVAGYLDTEIAAILADTNELQTDWANGGRLDLLIDGVKAKTDLIPASPAATSDIPSANTIADTVLGRSVSNVEGSAAEHSLCSIVLATLESSISGTTWTIRKTDGSSTYITKTVTTDAAADPITGVA